MFLIRYCSMSALFVACSVDRAHNFPNSAICSKKKKRDAHKRRLTSKSSRNNSNKFLLPVLKLLTSVNLSLPFTICKIAKGALREMQTKLQRHREDAVSRKTLEVCVPSRILYILHSFALQSRILIPLLYEQEFASVVRQMFEQSEA